jgi:hypothetical protein
MEKKIILITIIVALAIAQTDEEWENYKAKFGKEYLNEE